MRSWATAVALAGALLSSCTNLPQWKDLGSYDGPPELGLPEAEIIAIGGGDGLTFPDDIERYFPARAREQAVSGVVAVSCTAVGGGRLDGCQIMAETPPGRDFGGAARRISRRTTSSAAPGETVAFTLRFRAAVEVALDCAITTERVLTDCKVLRQLPFGTEVGQAQVSAWEGKSPPEGVPTLHPGRVRFVTIVTIPAPAL